MEFGKIREKHGKITFEHHFLLAGGSLRHDMNALDIKDVAVHLFARSPGPV